MHVGDFVYVEKGGEIIPKMWRKSRKRNVFATEIQYATHCPECGSELIRLEDQAAHFCPNETHCPPQVVENDSLRFRKL